MKLRFRDPVMFKPNVRITRYTIPRHSLGFVSEMERQGADPWLLGRLYGRKEDLSVKNLLVNNGLKEILDKWGEDASGNPFNGPQYIWVGDDDTAVLPTQTDLSNFLSEKAISSYTRSSGEFTGSFSVVFGTGDSNHLWKELGLGNDVNATGTMYARAVIPVPDQFTKTSGQIVTVDWDITASVGS